MLKKLKNYQIMDLAEGFMRIAKMNIKSNKKFSYAIILNDERIQPNVKAVINIAKPSDEYKEYEDKRNEIISKYADVDGDGNIILKDNRWVIFKESEKDLAVKELSNLNDEYVDVIDKRNEDIKEYNDLIESEEEINIHMVKLDDIPSEIGEDLFLMKLLVPMIDD